MKVIFGDTKKAKPNLEAAKFAIPITSGNDEFDLWYYNRGVERTR